MFRPIIIGTLRGLGGGGVGGLSAHNKDLINPTSGSIVPYPSPLYPSKGPYDIMVSGSRSSRVSPWSL